jgi:hypothetical protein
VAGRDIFLNGVPIRLRPQTVPQEWSNVSGDIESVNGMLKGLRLSGFNIGEMWPGSSQRRGQHHFHHIYYGAADRQGMLLMGSAGNIGDYIGWGRGEWNSPEARAEWKLSRAKRCVAIATTRPLCCGPVRATRSGMATIRTRSPSGAKWKTAA